MMGLCLSWSRAGAEAGEASRSDVAYSTVSSSPSSSTAASLKRKNSKKMKRSPSMEMRLHRIPGRIFLNGSTDNASLFTKQGKKPINQDAMIFWENFGSREDTIFCGVFDGHGPNGHMVAKKVRDSLPLTLSAQWQLSNGSKDDISASGTGTISSEKTSLLSVEQQTNNANNENKKSQNDVFLTIKESFLKAFKLMDKELKQHRHLECISSGTTAVTLLKQGQYLVIGNVGDSRAVLSTQDKNNYRIAVQLTVDQKPNLPKEAERIRLCKGRVFALQSEPEVTRIWMPNCDSPGLAMARAFGDFCLKDYGLISVPEITNRYLNEKDEFIVLATDGVWDVLSNEQVVDIVASASPSNAARVLVESAVRTWRYKYPKSKVDDCAAVCLFLRSNSDSFSTSFSQPEGQQVVLSQ